MFSWSGTTVAAAVSVGLAIYLARRKATPAEVPVLYLWPRTTCSRRVLMCLAELGCIEGRDYVIVVVKTTGDQKTAEHKKRHPLGKIPVWREGDWMLYESMAICEYLCTRFPGAAASTLLPPPGRERAEVHKWVSFEATELRQYALKPHKERIVKRIQGLGDADEAVVSSALTDMAAPLDAINASLGSSAAPNLTGLDFTLADLGFMPYLEALCGAGCEEQVFGSRVHLAAWWKSMRSRPTWQAVLERAKY